MAKIWNKSQSKVPKDAVYVGRPSIFGNPYSHRFGTLALIQVETREQAVTDYEAYARAKVKINKEFREAVKSLYGKDLVCWCAPEKCHAEVLMTLAEELHAEELLEDNRAEGFAGSG